MIAFRLLLPLFLLIFLGCQQHQNSEPLRIGTNEWPGYEPLHYANQENYYQTPVKTLELSSASEVLRAYKNKTIELAALTLDEALLLRSQGFKPVIIAILDISDGGDVIIAKKTFPTMQALKGKHVGFENTALGSFVLARALQIHSMNLSDIQAVPLEFGEHQNSFENGNIDAVVTFEPVKSHLLAQGYPMVFSSKEMPNEIVDVLVVREDIITEYPQELKKIVNALLKAQDDFTTNMHEVAASIAPRYRLPPEDFIKSLDGLQIPKNNEHIKKLQDINKTITKLSEVMIEKQLLHQPIQSTGLINTKFLVGNK